MVNFGHLQIGFMSNRLHHCGPSAIPLSDSLPTLLANAMSRCSVIADMIVASSSVGTCGTPVLAFRCGAASSR
jgi:hypothetical protein